MADYIFKRGDIVTHVAPSFLVWRRLGRIVDPGSRIGISVVWCGAPELPYNPSYFEEAQDLRLVSEEELPLYLLAYPDCYVPEIGDDGV